MNIHDATEQAYKNGYAATTRECRGSGKVVHIHEEYLEHDWFRNNDGTVDMWAMESGYCNGPMCRRCYDSFCEHCNPDWAKEGPCIVDQYTCPNCGKILNSLKSQNFCDNCGTHLDWNGIE